MEPPGFTARATSFLLRVQSYPQLFNQYMRVMNDYSTNKLDYAGADSELNTLFQFHRDLLTEYKNLVSERLKSKLLSSEQSRNKPDLKILKPCIHYMNKVQNRFADEGGVIMAYLDTIRSLKEGNLCNEEAYNAIAKIFGEENQDLVDEFEFLFLDKKEIRKNKKKKNSSSSSNKKTLDDLKRSELMEDEMCELDIDLALGKKTMACVNMLMNSAEEERNQLINIDNSFSAVSLGYIEKVYKEEDDSILTRLRDDPRSVLPEILEKLKSKEEDLSKKWSDIHEKKKNPADSLRKLRSIV
uniref:SIN3 component, histone deacetylase complex n=1 Tax=Solanum tuberosum TaxID=4113 RepID=M0ZJ34_SOLTU